MYVCIHIVYMHIHLRNTYLGTSFFPVSYVHKRGSCRYWKSRTKAAKHLSADCIHDDNWNSHLLRRLLSSLELHTHSYTHTYTFIYKYAHKRPYTRTHTHALFPTLYYLLHRRSFDKFPLFQSRHYTNGGADGGG